MSHNPYAKSTDIYSQNAKAATVDQRSLEGQILMKAAQKMEVMKERLLSGEEIPLLELDEVVNYNRKLWTVFAGEAANEEHPLPQEIKNNIASLAIFVFKHSLDIMASPVPSKFDSLIEINKNIASGMLKSTENDKKESNPLEDTTNNNTDMASRSGNIKDNSSAVTDVHT